MLLNSLNESSNDGTLPLEASEYPAQHPSIAKPSNTSMGLEGQDERSDVEDRSEYFEDGGSDEDADMSDGGAALTMTMSHAEQLNAELDMLDAEVMGSDNLVTLLMDNQYQPALVEHPQFSYHVHNEGPPNFTPNSEVVDENVVNNDMGPGAATIPMSAVALQLQHIQEGQGHPNLTFAPDTQHGVQDNSTLPLSYHPLFSTLPFHAAGWVETSFISLAEASPAQHPMMTLGAPNASHLLEIQAGTLLMLSQHPLGAVSFLFADFIGSDDDQVTNADQDSVDDQFNFSLAEFLINWAHSYSGEDSRKRPRGPSLPGIERQRILDVRPVTRNDLHGDRCDIQRIDWADLGVSRLEARQMRRQTYKNYTNLRMHLQWHPRLNGARLSDDQNYFRFRKMDFDLSVHLSHFQLRNLLSCSSRDHIFYAGRSVVHQYTSTSDPGTSGPTSVAMDLTNPTVLPAHVFPGGGVQISTLTVAHDLLIAGGFSGEYGMINLRASKKTEHTEGILTNHANGITNHVQIYLPRYSSSPVAAFASNDMSVRVLDVRTNKLVAEHKYEHAINCTAMSPDQRLRVLVGDNRNVIICNAETGEILQDLEGHRDFGFACDWADDGWTVATGNQDMQVKIWDARKWKSSSGIACPVATIAAEMAGVRKLKFSPVGSGKRVLIAAEPADFVNVIDAETFTSKQALSFFGEIGGVDFTNEGQDLIVANCDTIRGGIMEFERCNFAAEATHDLQEYNNFTAGRCRSRREHGYDWKSDDQVARSSKSRRTQMQRIRRAAILGTNMGIF